MKAAETSGITSPQRSALALLAPIVEPETYLVGGVAIALRLKHRLSLDVDLFVPRGEPELLADPLTELLPAVRITGRAPGTLHLEVEGVPTSIIRYAYPLLSPCESVSESALPVASLEDLACMKLSAIAGRGAAKDFWDLHEIVLRGPKDLRATLDSFRRKYVSEDVGHVVRSLAYFADAEAAPMPMGLTNERWRTIRSDFERWVAAL